MREAKMKSTRRRWGFVRLVVLPLVTMFLLVASVGADTLYFQPTNVAQPSLYQTMQLQFTGWSSLSGDPTTQVGDWVYMVANTAGVACSTTPPSPSNQYFVTPTPGGSAATVTLVVSPPVFAQGTSYAACYVSTQNGQAYLTQNSVIDSSQNLVTVSFVVLGAIYPAYSVSPTTVYAGQGLATVTITETDESSNGRSLNRADTGVGSARPYFLACATLGCTNYAAVANACASSSGVTFSSISGYATTTLTGTFTAPQAPDGGGYAVCVPYCYSATANCGQSSYSMSWTVVVASSFVFLAANPGAYSVQPTAPTVRMYGTLVFTGSGLTSADRMKIIALGGSCSSTSSALLSNVNYNQGVTFTDATNTSTQFRSLNLITTNLVGLVCYARGANPTLFAPVFQLGNSAADFVITPMQPSLLVASPASPTLGQTFVVTYTGTSLSSSADAAYLIASSSSTCTLTASTDPCDGTGTSTRYTCTLTGSGPTSTTCSVLADPDTNSAITLCACYRPAGSSNYLLVNGSITLQARNPVYTLSPYPLYAGQSAALSFSGSGLSAQDTVRFVAANALCTDTPVTNVSTYNASSTVSTVAQFSVVGPGNLCLRICYQFFGTSSWVITRPSTAITVDASCDATQLFIAPFAMSHSDVPLPVQQRATISMVLSSSTFSVTSFVVVTAEESCVLQSCGSTGAACAKTPSAADYFSSLSSGSAVYAVAASGTQVLCVSLGSASFIPIFSAPGSTTYTFVVAAQNPSAFTAAPTMWRVAQANLNVTFAGTSLNATNDILRAIGSGSLLSSKGVCPLEAAIVSTVLTTSVSATQDMSSSTSVSFSFRGADALAAGTVVNLCYYRGVSGSRIATYVGSMTLLAQNPANFTTSGTLRAGELIALSFPAGASSSVDHSRDALTFYQYQASSIAPTCRCDAQTCATAIAVITTSIPLTGSTSASSWRDPIGFSNYASDAVYVVCYQVAAAGVPTYLGQLSIVQAHPSYYTLSSSSFRVGLPVTVTVTTLCSSCTSLSASDSIILVLNATQCADSTGLNATTAEAVSATQFVSPQTVRSLVPLIAGYYRVCYKKAADTVYSELAYTSQFLNTAIHVTSADPASFAPIPATPTAGQYLIVNLTSCSSTTCGNCGQLRLARGAAASCWNTSLPSSSSTSCVGSSTLYEYPDVFFAAGTYTVCFGDGLQASRVPGTLTVGAANPSSFTVASSSIFTNQGAKDTFTLTGTGLSASDKIFILPNISYTCHDLRNSQLDILANPTFFGWWTPSTSPYAISATGPIATWVATDSLKRFSPEIVTSAQFCDHTNVSCGLQLCYLRAGTSWAPVTRSASTAPLVLYPANPSAVVFDVTTSVRVTQYVLPTVTGTGLRATDYVYFADGLCESGAIVANTTSPRGTVTTDATTWKGVLRFVNRNSGTVRGCYVSATTTTEIPSIPSLTSIAGTVFYTKLSVWNDTSNFAAAQTHTITQYESFYFAGTTSATGSSTIPNVATMYTVRGADECNYLAFPSASYAVATAMTRADGQTSYFLGRFLSTGTYALCLNTSGLLFRITSSTANTSAAEILVIGPNPSQLVLTPAIPFQQQNMTVTFVFATATGAAPFEPQNITGDAVRLISGSVLDCGMSNATVDMSLVLSPSGQLTVALPNATAGQNWTLCYKKVNGSFATVPRGSLIDRNIQVNTLYPQYYSTIPLLPQRGVSLNITFYSNATGPLSIADRPFLTFIADASRTAPTQADCNSAQTRALTSTAVSIVSATSSAWRITSALAVSNLTTGNYTVCYVVASNGAGAYVPFPGFLTVAPRQDPTAFFTDSLGGTSTVFMAERIHVFFVSTSAVLAPVLNTNPATTSNSSDLVAFATSSLCTSNTWLTNAQVSAVPDAFGYQTPSGSGTSAYFLHVRFRVTGTFYVCMKRSQRAANEQFYSYDAVGGPDSPQALTVVAAPIASALLVPSTPRALVPSVALQVSFTTGFTVANVASLFFTAYSNVTAASDNISVDGCYFPDAASAALPASTVLLNTSLQVSRPSLVLQLPFPSAGWYKLCFAAADRTVGSLPAVYFVQRASPNNYTVPAVIGPGGTFSMVFSAADAIFSPSALNVATIYRVDGSGVTSSFNSTTCASLATTFPSASGISNFTAFTGDGVQAAVAPLLTASGTYFVCFKTSGQTQYATLPNSAGGYTFPVGVIGATNYTTNPATMFVGQLIQLDVIGIGLSPNDTVKIALTTNSTTNYFSLCASSSTTDSNRLNPAGVSSVDGVSASTYSSSSSSAFQARLLASGTYVMCYLSVVTGSWSYVPDIPSFFVGPARPSPYSVSPSNPLVGQSFNLSVSDTSAAALSPLDSAKLVVKTSAAFDCTEATPAVVALTSSTTVVSSSVLRTWTICNETGAQTWVVCYKLQGGSWAEVPAFSNGSYAPLVIRSNPISVTTIAVSSVPRPLEPFTLTFSSSDSISRVVQLRLASAGTTLCNITTAALVTPLRLVVLAGGLSASAIVAAAGAYQLLTGLDSNSPLAAIPNYGVAIAPCDPCTFTPSVMFTSATASYLLSFASTSGTFHTTDRVRLVPSSLSLSLPTTCSSSAGSFGSLTLAPTSVGSGASSTARFAVATAAVSTAGTYYACYRKNTTTDFAVTASSTGTPVVLNLVAPEPSTFTVCPLSPFAGQGLKVTFQTSSAATLAPLSVLDSAFITTQASCDSNGANAATDSNLTCAVPNGTVAICTVLSKASTSSAVQRVCYRHTLDTGSRSMGTFSLLASNPSGFVQSPAEFTVGLTTMSVTLLGSGFSSDDAVFFVPNTTSCVEYCGAVLSNITNVSPPFLFDAAQATTATIQLLGAFTAAGEVSICYRRSGGTLAKVPQTLTIGPANPTVYGTNFTTRLGTRPVFNFSGRVLSAADVVKVVPVGIACDSDSVFATGAFYSVDTVARLWSAFHVPLITPIVVGEYTVCYNVNGTGFVPVAPTLTVLPGGPSHFSLSNTLLANRATVLSFPEQNFTVGPYRTGDETKIVCGSCSCWDDAPVTPSYGEARQTVATAGSPATPVRTAMRFGFALTTPVSGAPVSYVVCYRISDSGFARVGSATTFLSVISDSSLTSSTVAPVVAYQGQRLTYSVRNSVWAPTADDQVMLVDPSRACWDTPAMQPASIWMAPVNVTPLSTASASSVIVFPSLGPTALTYPAGTFPLTVALCFRQAGQDEYLNVINATSLVLPVSPVRFVSAPVSTEVRVGMINVSITFPEVANASAADRVFAVVGTFSDRICDSSTSTVVESIASASSFVVTVSAASPITFCYVRTGDGTVAEVTQQLVPLPANPSAMTTNTVAGIARNRMYVAVAFNGTNLTLNGTSVYFSTQTCYRDAQSQSQPAVARASDLQLLNNASAIQLTIQVLVATASPFTVYGCVFLGDAWSQAGTLAVLPAVPRSLVISPSIPRVGEHVVLSLQGSAGPAEQSASRAAVIATSGDNSWCHNFSVNLEPTLSIRNVSGATVLDSGIWAAPRGSVRVCALPVDGNPWVDVDDSDYLPSSIAISEPNPASQWTFPSPPRAGQRVTVYLSMSAPASSQDVVVLLNRTLVSDAAGCAAVVATANAVSTGLLFAANVTSWNSTTAWIEVTDATDSYAYRSFASAATVRACYYSANEDTWAVVGGTVFASSIPVLAASPDRWYLATGKLVAQKSATLGFVANTNVLSANDIVWAVPYPESCFIAPTMPGGCAACLMFELDPALSNGTVTQTRPFSSAMDGTFSICYALQGATAAMVPGNLSIATADIQCLVQPAVWIGRRQNLTFQTLPNINASADLVRVSTFLVPSGSLCNASLEADFVAGRAALVAQTSTTLTYSLEWPVTLNASQYSVCYRHEGEFGRVCSCEQFRVRSSDCFVATIPANPSAFGVSPFPPYVGESLNVSVAASTSVTAFVLVPYVDGLTTCQDAADASVTQGLWLASAAEVNVTNVRFKYRYLSGDGKWIVCAKIAGGGDGGAADEYARVPTSLNSLQVLEVRPFLRWAALPSPLADSGQLIRAGSTVQLTFSHQSSQQDDVVSSGDRVTLVADPLECNESILDGNETHAAFVLGLVSTADSSFDAVPAPVMVSATNMSRTAVVLTFADGAVGRSWFVCYRLASGGTWAPIAQPLTPLSRMLSGCVATSRTSAANSDDGQLRAFQHVPTRLTGNATVYNAVRTVADSIRLVPSSSRCYDDAATVFNVTAALNFSAALVTAMLVSPSAEPLKLCYRVGNASVSLFSPVCSLNFAPAQPIAMPTSGCQLAGQTLRFNASYVSGTRRFAAGDKVWFVDASRDCVALNGTEASPHSSVLVNLVAGVAFAVTGSAQSSVEIAPTTLPPSANSLRLCYRNVVGSYFTIPVNSNSTPTYVVAPRQPLSAAVWPSRPQVSQLVVATYAANPAAATTPALPALTASNATASPFPPLDAVPSFDSGGVARVTLSAGLEGQCYAAHPREYQAVLGALATDNSTLTSTAAQLIPVIAGTHVACYRLVGCSIADAPTAFRIFEANPAAAVVVPSQPRKGQLFNETYQRVTNESDAALLAPSLDRGAAVTFPTSCFSLDSALAGFSVRGSTTNTWTQLIVYADAPTAQSNATVDPCYLLAASPSWSAVPNSRFTVVPANPTEFVTALTPMAFSMIVVTFLGHGFTAGDRVKILALSLNCSDSAIPPSHITAIAQDNSLATGTENGWSVSSLINTSATTFRVATGATGTFSVCYRLASDTVWTLVYGNLVVAPRNPEGAVITPTSALEGELFSVNLTRISDPAVTLDQSLEMTGADQLELRPGTSVSCLTAATANFSSAAPERTDMLPALSTYVLSAAARGNYTLCYVRNVQGTRYASWGFPTVTIQPNPTTYDVLIGTAPRANMLLGVRFYGFGLQSPGTFRPNRSDTVKFIDGALSRTDVSCRTAPNSASVVLVDFRASGNVSIQTIVVQHPGITLWVCYKLYGGEYHVMPAPLSVGAQSPTAMLGKSEIWDGEGLPLIVSHTTSSYRVADYVFLSLSPYCADILPTGLPSHDTAAADFSLTSATLSFSADTGTWNTTVRFRIPRRAPATVALCYRSPSASALGGLTTILANGIPVFAGVPELQSAILAFQAQRIVTMGPFLGGTGASPTGSLVAVATLDACTGTSVAAASQPLPYQQQTTASAVTAVFAASGTYYICATAGASACLANSTECARVVATVSVTEPFPWAWYPNVSVYVTEAVQLQFAPSNPVAPAVSASLRLISDTSSAAGTVGPCLLPSNDSATLEGRSVALAASRPSGGSTIVYTGRPTLVGTYAVCLNFTAADAAIAVFPAQTLSVMRAVVIEARSSALVPVVTVSESFLVTGRGLTSADQLLLVALPFTTSALFSSATVLAAACQNRTLTPVVSGTSSSAAGTFGASALAFTATFTLSTVYAVCYQPTSEANATLASSSPLIVAPLVTAVQVPRALFALSPFPVTLQGVSLRGSDRLAFVTDAASCSGSAAPLTLYPSTTPSGTSVVVELTFSITLGSTGSYFMCFWSSVGTAQLLPDILTFQSRRVVSVAFAQAPSCAEWVVCAVQPTLSMLDSSGAAANDIGAVAQLHLMDAATGGSRDEALLGTGMYSVSTAGVFSFVSMLVAAAGTFVLRAEVVLLGGVTLSATSPAFVVAQNNSLRTLTLTCSPAVVNRSAANVSDATVSCIIEANTNLTASKFALDATSGAFVSPLVNSSVDPVALLPRHNFTVQPLLSNLSSSAVFITATAVDPRYPGRNVSGSPAVVRIVTQPDESSTLLCASGLTFGSVSYVRAGSTVSCALQGNVNVGGVVYPIIAPSSAFVVTTVLVNVSSQAVILPPLPPNTYGTYTFHSAPAPLVGGGTLQVTAVLLSALLPIVGSPVVFIVLSAPSPSTSAIVCASTNSGSVQYFLPGEAATCTLTLRDDLNTAVLVPSNDLNVSVDRGSVISQFAGRSLLQDRYTFTVYAPLGNNAYRLAARREYVAQASVQDQRFTVAAIHTPTNALVATASGVIVLVTDVLGAENLVAGTSATLELAGSGLSLLHTYLASLTTNCSGARSAGLAITTTASSSVTAGNVILSFRVPSSAFYLCFSPNGTNAWQLLLQGSFRNVTTPSSNRSLTDDDIILLVVGLVAFVILALLLPFVVMRLRTIRAVPPEVAYAPRVNDQFIYKPVVSVPITPVGTPHQAAFALSAIDVASALQPAGATPAAPPLEMDEAAADDKAEASRDKRRRKKVDASIRKIANMQQHALETRSYASEPEEPVTPPAAPPLSVDVVATTTPRIEREVVVEEQRHRVTTQFGQPFTWTSYAAVPPPGFMPPPSPGTAPQQQQTPVTPRGAYVVPGHTSVPFVNSTASPRSVFY